MLLGGPWHDHNMSTREATLAEYFGRLRCEAAQCHVYDPKLHGDAQLLREALRHAGVPVLELNNAPAEVAEVWIAQAKAISAEYVVPVFVFGAVEFAGALPGQVQATVIEDLAWLDARQVALTAVSESSALNSEARRTREKAGCLYIGWQPEAFMAQGNTLVLAWSSPLPLRRIRDFSARCPDLLISGPDVESLARDVAAQGISTAGWRFEVK